MASAFGLPPQVGLLGGTVSLIGGHGTTIAWSPIIAEDYGINNALEIGIACATCGLVLASTMGGPIAKYLIAKHKLQFFKCAAKLMAPAHASRSDAGFKRRILLTIGNIVLMTTVIEALSTSP